MPSTKKSKPVAEKPAAGEEYATREELMALALLLKKHFEFHEMLQVVPKNFQGHTVHIDLGKCQFCQHDHQLHRVYSEGNQEPTMLCAGCISVMDDRGAAH
jgi:hypothetical protein